MIFLKILNFNLPLNSVTKISFNQTWSTDLVKRKMLGSYSQAERIRANSFSKAYSEQRDSDGF